MSSANLPAPHCLPAPGKSQIHEWFALEGTFEDHLVQSLVMGRDIFPQITLLQAPSNLTLNTSSDGVSTVSSGQPVPVSHHPRHIIFLPYVQSKFTLFHFNPLPLVLSLQTLIKSLSPSLPLKNPAKKLAMLSPLGCALAVLTSPLVLITDSPLLALPLACSDYCWGPPKPAGPQGWHGPSFALCPSPWPLQLPPAFLPESACHLVHTPPCGSRKRDPSLRMILSGSTWTR